MKWLQSYLKLKNQFDKINKNNIISDSITSTFGILQGTILGPILLIIYIKELFKK